jgi:hypothetical protein
VWFDADSLGRWLTLLPRDRSALFPVQTNNDKIVNGKSNDALGHDVMREILDARACCCTVRCKQSIDRLGCAWHTPSGEERQMAL